jgi:histidinol-phosphate aminotransferase
MKDSLILHMLDKWSDSMPCKPNRVGYINLSSNTLQHPKLQVLHKKFFSDKFYLKTYAYPDYDLLREYFSTYFGIGIDQIGFVGGTDNLISSLMQCASSLSIKKIFLQTPFFYNYMNYAQCHRLQVEALIFNNLFLESTLESLSNSEPTFIFLTSPCALTGEIIPKQKLSEWISIVKNQGHFVVLDQAYCGFGSEVYFQLLKQHTNLIIFQTFSKAFGGAGFRFGFYVGCSDLIKRLRSIGIENTVSMIASEYAVFALKNEKEFNNIRADIVEWRNAAYSYFKTNYPNFNYFNSQANFISFDTRSPKLSDAIVDSLLVKRIFLKKQPEPYCGYLRITVAPLSTLNEVFPVIQEATINGYGT